MTSYPLSDFSGFMTSAAVLYTQFSYEDVPLLHMAYAVMIHSWLLVVIGARWTLGMGSTRVAGELKFESDPGSGGSGSRGQFKQTYHISECD